MLNGVVLDLGNWATDPVRRAIYDGHYEAKEVTILAASLRAEDVVVEVGAGAGFVTAVAARMARRVVAYEADPAMVFVAQRTLLQNCVDAQIRHAALGSHDGETTFYVQSDFWTSSLRLSQGTPVTVSVEAIGTALADVTYLIMDIEGAETDLLADGVPSSVRAICVETHPQVTGAGAIADMLHRLLEDGFVLDVDLSDLPVLLLRRAESAR